MFDFGSILGSGTVYAQRHRAGNEYIFEWTPGWLTLATLGLYIRPWMHIDYPDVPPSIGRFEGDAFDPVQWKPEYPNPAFDNMRADDAFWAARIVVALRRRGDPRHRREGALQRSARDRVHDRRARSSGATRCCGTWLNGVNPVVDFALERSGELTFANAAGGAGVATPADGLHRAVVAARQRHRRGDGGGRGVGDGGDDGMPRRRRSVDGARAGDYVRGGIAARHAEHPAWATPVTAHFRRTADRWTLVGLTSLP